MEGESIRFECRVESRPSSVILWEKDSVPINTGDPRYVTIGARYNWCMSVTIGVCVCYQLYMYVTIDAGYK